jgi:hypothetical protein
VSPNDHHRLATLPDEEITMTEPTTRSVDRYIECDRHIRMAEEAIRALRTTNLDQCGISLTQWHIFDKAPGKNRDQLVHELTEFYTGVAAEELTTTVRVLKRRLPSRRR